MTRKGSNKCNTLIIPISYFELACRINSVNIHPYLVRHVSRNSFIVQTVISSIKNQRFKHTNKDISIFFP